MLDIIIEIFVDIGDIFADLWVNKMLAKIKKK